MNNPPLLKTFGGNCSTDVTLRDLFAGMALMGMISYPCDAPLDMALSAFPSTAYQYADAILAERERILQREAIEKAGYID